MKYRTFKALQLALKQAGLPASRPYINILENLGVIPRPANSVDFHVEDKGFSLSDMRIYTEDEIQVIVEKVRNYKR